jgi:ubiquitin-protein ligase
MNSPRLRRLIADHDSVRQLVQQSTILDMSCSGDPVSTYLFRFNGRGLALDSDGNLMEQWSHEVRVHLGANYPRVSPELHWLTPIFHPNISANGLVCLGGYSTHWVPSLRLDDLCLMLWDMIRYRNFDISSPYNRTAAEWAKTQRHFILPLDPRSLRGQTPPGGTVSNSVGLPNGVPAQPNTGSHPRPVGAHGGGEPTSSFHDTRVGWNQEDTGYNNQGSADRAAEITFL